jgi:hypothetical protein
MQENKVFTYVFQLNDYLIFPNVFPQIIFPQ